MLGVLQGFAIIGAVVLLGYVLAVRGVVDEAGQQLLARLVFLVGTPALLFSLVRQAHVTAVLGPPLLIAAVSASTTAVLYLLGALLFGQDRSTATIGALSSCYVNAGNLGLPVAVYVLGDGAAIAPILLLQLLVLTPLAFAVLDIAAARDTSIRERVTGPLRNPVTLATLLGFLDAVSGLSLPGALVAPIDLVAGLAVPSALLAYGASLRHGPRALADGDRRPVLLAAGLKLIVQPAAATAVGAWGCHLQGKALLTVALVAGLPTAQNIFVYASRYDRGVVLARDVIAVTTVGCLVTLTALAALLG